MSNVPTLPEHGPLKTRVMDLAEFLGRPHMGELFYTVAEVLEPPVRFQDIMDVVKISPTTLTARLKEAVAAGLLERRSFDENPPRVEYQPTQKLQDLLPVFIAMNTWCREYELAPAVDE